MYPEVDKSKCIECGACKKVCPFLNEKDSRQPIQVLAAVNRNTEVRLKSSSGGIFSVLAEKIINDGGIVFGVKFDDNWEPVFGYAETIDGINAFRGSKYVQAKVGTAYIRCKEFLHNGRKVLFSGTPCQISGLKHFLNTDYNNLITVDIVCHGVPSPGVWRKYLNEIIKPERREERNTTPSYSKVHIRPVITNINFRDKKLGWRKFSLVISKKSNIEGKNKILLSEINASKTDCFNLGDTLSEDTIGGNCLWSPANIIFFAFIMPIKANEIVI